MVSPQLMHFVVRSLTSTYTPAGVLVTCYTNYPCHLWMRWTAIIPQKHVNTKMVRGAPIGTYIDQCFVVYKDLEQNEPGDTSTHTFTAEPWPGCETRWFYFWGTVQSVLSPSASAIFSYHREILYKLYSDPGSGAVTCDGEVQRIASNLTWAQLHDGPPQIKDVTSNRCFTWLSAHDTSGRWRSLVRSKLTFDLSSIPPTIEITSCSLYFYVYVKNAQFSTKPTFALVTAPAPPYNDVPLSDYNSFGAIALSNVLHYDDIPYSQFSHLDFTPPYLPLLIPGSKVSLSIREMTNDAADSPPPWQRNYSQFIGFYSVDHASPSLHPYLLLRGTLKT